MFNTIYYIYDTYIYRGTMRHIHGKGYSREHALGVFAFLQYLNMITITNLLRGEGILYIGKVGMLSIGVVIYFLNRYFFADKELMGKPSGLMIAGAIFYAIASVGILCLSFIRVVPG